MSLAAPLALREGDRERLGDLARLPSVPSGLARRARMVLLAADGVPNAQIAWTVGVSRPTVIGWRDRYVQCGIAALEDEPRSGRPTVIDEIDVVVATLTNEGRPPQRLGISHWSARFLAAELGISFASVARIWRKWDIQPHRIEGFKFSTDPELEFKIRDVVGLYLDPPANAVVVSVDEKSQIQALDRTAPMLPLRPSRQTYDYKRNGTATLFAALEVATGRITADACYPRHRHQEFVRFLKKVAAAHPAVELHIVADNYAAHKHPAVKAWLKDNPRITLHFTPTSCSWLNMVEIFFGIITRQAIRRGTFRSVKDLTAAIAAYNDRCQPFTWTKDADELLARIRPSKTVKELSLRQGPGHKPGAVPGNERARLSNLLESLYRLYDRQRGPADADALLTATASAVKDQSWISSIEQASTALRDLIRSRLPPEEEYRVLTLPGERAGSGLPVVARWAGLAGSRRAGGG